MNLSDTVYFFIALYFAAVIVEASLSHYHKKGVYDLWDTLVNFSLGTLGVLLRMISKGSWLALWIYLYQFAPIKITENVWSWIALFFGNEFIYYWFHRLSHENKWLWAVHVNHHSSEKLNFSTAARVPLLNIVLHNIFWIPLLFIGFSPMMIFTVETIGFLFAFILHTQLIRRIPVFEWFFNSPAHHRVHHACNPEYLNKNYGNVLIIFDRIFGTFKDEDCTIESKFGLTKNIRTYNLLKIIFHAWSDAIKTKKLGNRPLIESKNQTTEYK